MGYSLGVDLGTTFVAAAVASATRIEMFTLGDRSVVTPAAVYLREDGTLVTGEAASLRAVSSPDRVSREFKRRLGSPTPVILGGQPHTVTALLGTVLRDVVRKVIETEGEPPDNVVLTHPANWGPFRRALFEEVPRYAGLDNPPMVTEPEAAAAHYAATRLLADGETVAVYDLGGGTFDATVLRALPSGVEILGTPEGIERLGGVDFDESILSHVDYTSDGAIGELDMRDPQTIVALARLRQDCILAKEALSVDTETILPVFLPGRHFDVRITRSDFEDLVRAPIESTIGALSRTLHSAQVQPTDLSAVLLVGGSSRIPLIARMVSAELGRPTLVDTHPKYAVALGAATLAAAAGAPTLLGEGLAGVIPAQRTSRHEALGNPAGSTLAGGFRRGTTPVRTPALEGKPRPAQPPASGTPSPDNGAAGSRGGPAQSCPRMAPDTNGVTEMPAPVASAPSAPAAVTGLGRRGWVLIAIAVLVLAGTVALVLAVGANRPPSAATAAGPALAAGQSTDQKSRYPHSVPPSQLGELQALSQYPRTVGTPTSPTETPRPSPCWTARSTR